MVAVISGSNRKNSKTAVVSNNIYNMLKTLGEEAHLIELDTLNLELAPEDIYDGEKLSQSLVELQDTKLIPADKVIYVSPEYNGSFAGFLKYFIDIISVRKYKETFSKKKCFLVGVAAGRAGNLRGIDHLTGVLNHVGSIVMPGSLPLSQISGLLDETGNFKEEPASLLKSKLEQFIAF